MTFWTGVAVGFIVAYVLSFGILLFFRGAERREHSFRRDE